MTHRNPWRTLSNNRRVFLDAEGRIDKGLPPMFHGVHVRDLSNVSRGVREIEGLCEVEVDLPETFPNVEVGVLALLSANPDLQDFVESEGGQASYNYRLWLRRKRRGPKPPPSPDGRFDPFNEYLELTGKNRISSWLEALHRTVPSSRRWEDFPDRLPLLEDATGLRLNLPGPAEEAAVALADIKECRTRADEAVDDLLSRARHGRWPGRADAPF
jgi:hypothetical protein